MNFDASVETKDYRGFTPLHIAAKAGNEVATYLLLEAGAQKDVVGDSGKTPLHRASSPKIVRMLLRANCERIVPQKQKLPTKSKLSSFEGLLFRNPEAAIEFLHHGVFTNDLDLDSSECLLIYDFDLFVGPSEDGKVDYRDEMLYHVAMTYHQKELLKHPLPELFLHLKWERTKRFFFVNLLICVLYALSLTTLALVSSKVVNDCHGEAAELNTTTAVGIQSCLGASNSFTAKRCFFAFHILTGLFTLVLLLREFIQACRSFDRHWKSGENWLELTMIALTVAYMTLIFYDVRVSSHLGAVCVFLAWIDLTLLVGRFPSVGIYIIMSFEIMVPILTFFLVFSTTLLAFAFSFYLLLPLHDAFGNPLGSLVKVLVMMVGEFDYESNFIWDAVDTTREGNGTAQVLFITFYFMISIILSNLIIGLTVNQTEMLFKQAGVIRLGKTVKQIVGIEDILFRSKSTYMPATIRNNLLKHTQLGLFCESRAVCVPMKTKKKNAASLFSHSPLSSQPFHKEYHIYLYDMSTGTRGASLDITAPPWVIEKTIALLKEEQQLEISAPDEIPSQNEYSSDRGIQDFRKSSPQSPPFPYGDTKISMAYLPRRESASSTAGGSNAPATTITADPNAIPEEETELDSLIPTEEEGESQA